MFKKASITGSLLLTLISVQPAWALFDDADASVQHSGAASEGGSDSAVHTLSAAGQATSATVAVPVGIAGSVADSAGSEAVGGSAFAVTEDLLDAASTAPGEPLPISDEVVISESPAAALAAPQ